MVVLIKNVVQDRYFSLFTNQFIRQRPFFIRQIALDILAVKFS
jgi:hypothetical protein